MTHRAVDHKVRRLFWIVTNSCNLHCRYCYYNVGLEGNVRGRPPALKDGNIKSLPTYFDQVSFTGGEPLVHPDIFSYIRAVKDVGLKVCINTNGVLLSEDNVREIVDCTVDSVSVSLDAVDPSINDVLRGGTKDVLRGIETLRKIGPQVEIEISATLSRDKIPYIRSFVDYCKERGMDLFMSPLDSGDDKQLSSKYGLENLRDEEWEMLSSGLLYWAQFSDSPKIYKYIRNLTQFLRNGFVDDLECNMGSDHFVLDVDGSLYPCFLKKDLNLGSLEELDLEYVMYQSQNLTAIRDLKNAKCVKKGCLCLTLL